MSVRRYATLSVVLVGGALAALPFYKHPSAALPATEIVSLTPPAEVATDQSGPSPEIKPPSIAVETVPAGFVGPVGGTSEQLNSSDSAEGTTEWLRPTPIALSSEHESLPELAQLPTFRVNNKNRSAATILEPDFTRSGPASEPGAGTAELSSAPAGQPIRKAAPLRRHRIVDGDALPAIALRYLGDERRYPEILAMNSDLLPDPSLLPVGKTLLIPSGDAAGAQAND